MPSIMLICCFLGGSVALDADAVALVPLDVASCSSRIGASCMTTRQTAAIAMAKKPGPNMPYRHPKFSARPPAKNGMRKPPKLIEACQIDHQKPRSLGSNQLVIILTQGGAARPWKQPFKNQNKANMGNVELSPNATLSAPQIESPRQNTFDGLILSPRTPPKKREEP
eukprot:CAMPEP_0115197022 /NCGR_PEP_ID=MMETSP0270-20121206/15385_1 /TAXON_ID=71861 /ORGANISM="Scrippsiella trochoidea, Strain CCMP3099" /LENGTH=167 /DNA_ID=CAMNT_0002610369 /DNA_START=658 /DNA_END=1161 /DNA_ORIENTATION=-